MDGSVHTERNVDYRIFGVDRYTGNFTTEAKLAKIVLDKMAETENIPHVFKTRVMTKHVVSLEHVAALEFSQNGTKSVLPINGRASVKTVVKLRQKQ